MNGGAGGGAAANPWTTFCTVVGVDSSSFSYPACTNCERAVPDAAASKCHRCLRSAGAAASGVALNRLFRLLISVATEDRVLIVVFFDRAARALTGCSANELFSFCEHHPGAAEKVGELLEGEMLQVTLARPKSGNAQHLRAAQVVPMRSGFVPVMEMLKKIYGI